jgi:O-antigen/teichoic acid export membrane protein
VTGQNAKSLLARNTVWSVVTFALQFLVPILLVPYMVSRVGKGHYGLWVAIYTLTGWFSFYDLGIWGPLVRDVAERQVRADRDGLRTLWATWFTFDLAAGAVLVAGAVAAAPELIRYFAAGLTREVGMTIFIGLAVQSVLAVMMRHLNSTLQGLQRLDLTNNVSMAVLPPWLAGQVAVLEAGWGIRGLMLNGLVFTMVQVGILLALVHRTGYPVTYSPLRFSTAELRRLVSFGWKVQANLFLTQAFRNDRVVMSRHGSSERMIAVYQFGAGIMDRLAGAVGVLSTGILSAASDLVARNDFDRLRILFLRGTKYHAVAAFGLLGFAAFFGDELMMLWMGEPLPESVRVLRIMAAGGIATAIGSCGHAVVVALGRPGWLAISSGLGLSSTVFLYTTVGRRYDYLGLAASVSAGLALIQIVFMIGLRRFLEFRWREYVGNALVKPAVLAVPLALVYAGWRALAPHLPPVDTRLRAFLVLVPAFLIASALGWAMARMFRVVDDYDLDVLKSSIRRASA